MFWRTAGRGIYATLVPEDTEIFTASASVDGINYLGKALDLEDGQVMFIRPPGLENTVDQTQSPKGSRLAGRLGRNWAMS